MRCTVKKLKFLSLLLMLITVISVCVSCNTPTANYEKGLKMREEYIKFLNDKYKDYKEVPYGLDITKKTDIVSICYSTWFNVVLGNSKKPPNITEILKKAEETGTSSGRGCGL